MAKTGEKEKGNLPVMQIHGGITTQKTEEIELNGYVTLKKMIVRRSTELMCAGDQ